MQPHRTMRPRAVVVPCQHCGESFKVIPSDIARGKGKYCSRTCADSARRGVEFRSVQERFWEKVDRNGPISGYRPDLGPCWLWTAGLNADGYGAFYLDGRRASPLRTGAHRVSWISENGSIPEDLVIDHLCRVRHCVRPDHLELVTIKENSVRGAIAISETALPATCIRGHSDWKKRAGRVAARECRTCRAEWARAKWHSVAHHEQSKECFRKKAYATQEAADTKAPSDQHSRRCIYGDHWHRVRTRAIRSGVIPVLASDVELVGSQETLFGGAE